MVNGKSHPTYQLTCTRHRTWVSSFCGRRNVMKSRCKEERGEYAWGGGGRVPLEWAIRGMCKSLREQEMNRSTCKSAINELCCKKKGD